MLLDIGNSAVKWATAENHRFTAQGRFAYREAGIGAMAGEAWGALPAPSAVVAASVAGPAVAAELADWTAAHWRLTPEYVEVGEHAAGVTNGYRDPHSLGVDRWAAMVAAWHDYGGPLCLVDCGTAITIDAVDADGRHLGGLIAPGTAMLTSALLEGTAAIRLEPAPADPPLTLLAADTRAAVDSGVRHTCSAMIDRAVADIVARLGEATTLLVTGGDAERLAPLAAWPLQHDADLVLRGVAILAGEHACAT